MPFSPPIADSSWLAPIAFALGCGLLTAILLRRSYRYFGKRKRGVGRPIDTQPRPATAWDGARHDAEARFNRQQVELHDLARDLTGQIDSKLILLRELVAQSDRQIARLEELLDEAERREPHKN
ncbi:hypothetical protein [Botrimarina sp.]|uniref:hypothetical protein n=1 Tax=Botrimarina sp. TaxID=2795802 RepID=UPI0032ECBCED